MDDPTQQQQGSHAVRKRIRASSPAAGDRIEAIGTALRSGRTLTVCELKVYGAGGGGAEGGGGRTPVATGRRTPVRVNGRVNGPAL
ncbi:hypothetical protein [Streptomyces sp. NPDC003943]